MGTLINMKLAFEMCFKTHYLFLLKEEKKRIKSENYLNSHSTPLYSCLVAI